eukprot:888425-Pelagomonas_calceolata.AAC.8
MAGTSIAELLLLLLLLLLRQGAVADGCTQLTTCRTARTMSSTVQFISRVAACIRQTGYWERFKTSRQGSGTALLNGHSKCSPVPSCRGAL